MPGPTRLSTAAIALGAVTLCGVRALAGPIAITPTSVTLTPPASVAQVMVRNPSEDPLRLQAYAYAWVDTPEGNIKLTPTKDIVVFPQLVTIPIFGTQAIRAAILSPPGTVEKAYRIVLDVLPPLLNQAQRSNGLGVQLSIRTSFTIPVFQEPLVPRLSGEIVSAMVKHGTLDFTLFNTGNTHLGGDQITIVARDAGGRVVFSQPFLGWYVLTESRRNLSTRLPRGGCGEVRSITISLPARMNVPSKRVDVQTGVCG